MDAILTARHRREILSFAPGLDCRFIEIALQEHVHGYHEYWQSLLKGRGHQDWRGQMVTELGSRDELVPIAQLARELIASLSKLSIFQKEWLGWGLSEHRGHDKIRRAIRRPTAPWFPDDCPPELVPYLAMLRRLYEEADAFMPTANKRGAPARKRDLVCSIFSCIRELYARPGEEIDVAKLSRPSGPLCRLVCICFEAIGYPQPSNVGQLVRRSMANFNEPDGERLRRYGEHKAQRCKPTECEFCSR